MGATRIEYEMGLALLRQQQKELQAQVMRMLGVSPEASNSPTRSPNELRREIAEQLGGISVSRMIIEAR